MSNRKSAVVVLYRMSRVRRSVRAWSREAADEITLLDSVVLFLMSLCLMIQKLTDFWNGPAEEYEEFFESFADLSLNDEAEVASLPEGCAE